MSAILRLALIPEDADALDGAEMQRLLDAACLIVRAGVTVSLQDFLDLEDVERLVLEEARVLVRREERNEDAAVYGMAARSEAASATLYAQADGGEAAERLSATSRRARLDARVTLLSRRFEAQHVMRAPVCEVTR